MRLLPFALALLCWAPPAFADTVLITGSDRGLGLEFARQYAAQGWDVIATARNPDGASDLKALAAGNKKVVIEKLDVSKDADVATLAVKYKGKPIDVLLNNAGVTGKTATQHFGSYNRKDFLEAMDVNAFGAIAVSQAFVENVAMSKQKKIVAITTTLGSIANAARATAPFYYRVTKSALNMSMQALGTELRPKGIIVAVCSPGAMDTAIIAAFKSSGLTPTAKGAPPAEAAAKVDRKSTRLNSSH